MHNGSIRSYGVFFPEIKEHGCEKLEIPVHEALQPPLLQSQRSFEGRGHIAEKRTLAQHLYTYPKVYVQSLRSLALLLHTERENLLKSPSIRKPMILISDVILPVQDMTNITQNGCHTNLQETFPTAPLLSTWA